MLVETLNPGATFLVICALLIGIGFGWVVRGRCVPKEKPVRSKALGETIRWHEWHNDVGGDT